MELPSGQLAPSGDSNVVVNFRTSKNNEMILNILKKFQTISFEKNINKNEIEHKILNEDGAAYILLKSNLRERPIKLLIDTGASISLLAKDIITEDRHIMNYTVNLYGVVGKDASIKTLGTVHSIFTIGDNSLESTLHLIDRKYAGPADGYLGYDFLSSYRVIININEMKMIFNLRNTEDILEDNKNQSQDSKLNPIEDFLYGYNFDDEFEEILLQKNLRKQNKTLIKPHYNKSVKHTKNNYESTSKKKNESDDEYSAITKFYKKKFDVLDSMGINPPNNEIGNILGNREYIFSFTQEDEQKTDRAERIFNKLDLRNSSESERKYIKNICKEFQFQFYLEGDMLKSTDVIKHHIKLIPNAGIVNVRQYRIPQAHREVLKEIVEDYERQGIIEKCQSVYNSPALIVSKKDEVGGKSDYRFVVDYKKLNLVTEIQNFPIPLIDDILNGLSGCEFFTTLDIKGAFHQIVLDEASRDYTAFTAGDFKYRWIRMPMGLAAAPLTWQMAIHIILTDLIGRGVYVYLDDVIIDDRR